MIILEGADCVGKSTLSKKLIPLLDDLKYPHVEQHFGLLPKSWDYCSDYIRNVRPGVVMDRFHMSELIYGSVVPGRTQWLDPVAYERVDSKITHVGGIVVLCWEDEETINGRFKEKNEHFSLDIIQRAAAAFNQLRIDGRFIDKMGRLFKPKMDLIVRPTETGAVDKIIKYYDQLQCTMGRLNRQPRCWPH
jgi:hypothetical protein